MILCFFMCQWSLILGTGHSILQSREHVKTLNLHLSYRALNDRCRKVLKYGSEKHKIAKFKWMATYFTPLFQSYRRTSSDWNSNRIQDCSNGPFMWGSCTKEPPSPKDVILTPYQISSSRILSCECFKNPHVLD